MIQIITLWSVLSFPGFWLGQWWRRVCLEWQEIFNLGLMIFGELISKSVKLKIHFVPTPPNPINPSLSMEKAKKRYKPPTRRLSVPNYHFFHQIIMKTRSKELSWTFSKCAANDKGRKRGLNSSAKAIESCTCNFLTVCEGVLLLLEP